MISEILRYPGGASYYKGEEYSKYGRVRSTYWLPY
jgi:hypothetical protein